MISIDTHTHIVSDDIDRYPLDPAGLPGGWYREAPHTAEQLLSCMDSAGIDRAVLVQGVGAYSFDNSYAADAALAYPDRFWSACCIDVVASDAAEKLDYWIGERGMHGVRMFAIAAPGASWLDDEANWPLHVFERAQALGARIIATVVAHQLPQLRLLLARFPGLVVSLDHCGFAPLASAPPGGGVADLYRLAELPDVYLKLTTNVLDGIRERGGDATTAVEALVEQFGVERVMWGSDFCQTYDRPYADLVETGRRALATLSESGRAACLGGTAERIWGAA